MTPWLIYLNWQHLWLQTWHAWYFDATMRLGMAQLEAMQRMPQATIPPS